MMKAAQLIEQLKDKFQDKIIRIRQPVADKIYVTIKPEAVVEISDYVFNELKARFLITAGTDHREKDGDFDITHIFSFDEDKLFLCLQMAIDPADPYIDSITTKIPGANWAERELRDGIGVHPRNHPDPRRLILADDWPEGVYPLRRDIPHNYQPPPDTTAKPQLKEPPEGATVLPVGPFYPVLEEPAYFRLFIEGETIVGCDYRGFYNHRGIEKLGDSALTYNQICFMAERICGICGFIHSSCYCQAMEEAAGIQPPRRARYLRSLMLELERIHSHLLWLGIAGHIIGFETVLMQTWRIREPVMWLCEYISGNRKTYGMNLIGGVRRDVTADMMPRILEVVNKVEEETLAVADAIKGDIPLLMRLRDVGPLPYEAATKICVVGPTARGSGVAIDARVDHPYAAYDEVVPNKVVKPEGDILARTLVRVEELLESIRLVRELLKGLKELPEGDIMVEIEEEISPGREGISVVEAPRGEAIHYVLTGDNNRPYRWRVRAPTYNNLQAVPVMIQNQNIADVPIAIGSYDPCFSCTERVEVVDVKSGKTRIYTQEELIKRWWRR